MRMPYHQLGVSPGAQVDLLAHIETAFRQEAIAAMVLLPASLWLGRNWVEVALLAGSVLTLLAVLVAGGRGRRRPVRVAAETARETDGRLVG